MIACLIGHSIHYQPQLIIVSAAIEFWPFEDIIDRLAILLYINCVNKMEKLIPLISDIQDIIRKSDVSLEISLPMIAVVGSQSTGNYFHHLQAKVRSSRASLERNSCPKAKVLWPAGLFKSSWCRCRVTKSSLNLLTRKESIITIWRILKRKSNYRLTKCVETTKVSVQSHCVFATIPKKC